MSENSHNQSIVLFKKLSLIPLLRVHNHLNASSLFLNALLSEKWETLIKNDGMKMMSMWHIRVTFDEVLFQLEFKNKKNENFGICFKEDSESKMKEDFRVHQEENRVTLYHKTNQLLEASCIKAVELLSFLFPPTSYGHINISLGPRSLEFPFRVLLQLPRGTAGYIDIHADQEVDCADLISFLRKVKVVNTNDYPRWNTLSISARIKNLVKCDEILTEKCCFKIADARFLPNSFLKQLDLFSSEVGQNDFSSRDFNAFLRAWMENGAHCHLTKVTFDIREDQNIKMEVVMAGLNPHVGLPRIRDRWHLDIPLGPCVDLYPTAIDCAEGQDIMNLSQMVGTALLEPNRFTFVTWSSRFRWNLYVQNMERWIENHTYSIERANKQRDIIQRNIAGGKMEVFPDELEFLKKHPEIIRLEQHRLALAREIKEKLLTTWRNDGAVYVPPPPPPRASDLYNSPVLLLGSANVALDDVPLALKFSRQEYGAHIEYRKMHGDTKLRIIPITDVECVDKYLLYSMGSIIYVYSDSDSFDRLSIQFILLRKKYKNALNRQIRRVKSMLLRMHTPGSDQPDPFDVECFRKSSYSNLYEFDPNSPIDSKIKQFVEPVLG